MSDLFHENVSDRFLDRAFAVMALTPRHLYMILTKRPERMYEYLRPSPFDVIPTAGPSLPVPLVGSFDLENISEWEEDGEGRESIVPMWPLPNVWLGVSAERQRELEQRVPPLLATPAAVRFVSAEPLLGPLDLGSYLPIHTAADGVTDGSTRGPRSRNLDGSYRDAPSDGGPLDWVIVGGESGPKRRPMEMRGLHDIGRQCRRAGTPLFVKQDSAYRPGQQGRIDDELWAEKNWPTGASLL
jgi:protein gp37